MASEARAAYGVARSASSMLGGHVAIASVSLVCERLGRGGRIIAIDRSAKMIAAARQRNRLHVESGRAVLEAVALEDAHLGKQRSKARWASESPPRIAYEVVPTKTGAQIDRFTADVSTSGVTLTSTRTCPSQGEPDQAEYSVDDEGLTLYVIDGGITVASVLTKQ